MPCEAWADAHAAGRAGVAMAELVVMPKLGLTMREGAVSPLARRLAAELGVDLAAVQGSGPGGRVVRRDVERAAGIAESEPED